MYIKKQAAAKGDSFYENKRDSLGVASRSVGTTGREFTSGWEGSRNLTGREEGMDF